MKKMMIVNQLTKLQQEHIIRTYVCMYASDVCDKRNLFKYKVPYIGNHPWKKSFANHLLLHSL